MLGGLQEKLQQWLSTETFKTKLCTLHFWLLHCPHMSKNIPEVDYWPLQPHGKLGKKYL